MIQLLVTQRFGLLHAGKLLGTITVLDAIGGGLGPWVTGVLYDHTGDYSLALTVIAGALLFALVISVPLLRSARLVSS